MYYTVTVNEKFSSLQSKVSVFAASAEAAMDIVRDSWEYSWAVPVSAEIDDDLIEL